MERTSRVSAQKLVRWRKDFVPRDLHGARVTDIKGVGCGVRLFAFPIS